MFRVIFGRPVHTGGAGKVRDIPIRPHDWRPILLALFALEIQRRGRTDSRKRDIEVDRAWMVPIRNVGMRPDAKLPRLDHAKAWEALVIDSIELAAAFTVTGWSKSGRGGIGHGRGKEGNGWGRRCA